MEKSKPDDKQLAIIQSLGRITILFCIILIILLSIAIQPTFINQSIPDSTIDRILVAILQLGLIIFNVTVATRLASQPSKSRRAFVSIGIPVTQLMMVGIFLIDLKACGLISKMLTPSPKPRNNLFYGAILQKDPSYVRSIIPILITATIFYIIFYLITKYRHKLKNRFLIAVVIVMALFTTIYLHFGPVKRISDYDRSNYCEFETTQYDSCDGCIY